MLRVSMVVTAVAAAWAAPAAFYATSGRWTLPELASVPIVMGTAAVCAGAHGDRLEGELAGMRLHQALRVRRAMNKQLALVGAVATAGALVLTHAMREPAPPIAERSLYN